MIKKKKNRNTDFSLDVKERPIKARTQVFVLPGKTFLVVVLSYQSSADTPP